jgi:hypothetical protein
MIRTGAVSKLVELRAKTDRQLLGVIRKELKRAQILASVAATRESPLGQYAEKIVKRVVKLLPTISGVEPSEREKLESAVREVRSALECVRVATVLR